MSEHFRKQFHTHCDDVSDTAWPRYFFKWPAARRVWQTGHEYPPSWFAYLVAVIRGVVAMWRHHRPPEPWPKQDREWCAVGVVSR